MVACSGIGVEIAIDHGEDAVRCGNRLAVFRMHGPFVERLLGERLASRKGSMADGHRHHGEFRHHDEHEILRKLLGFFAEHEVEALTVLADL